MRALVVGLGGLGCPASLALAGAGVEALTLVDPDVVDVTNLHRQPWHHLADVGRPKVRSAGEKLARQFGAVEIVERVEAVTAGTAEALLGAHDVALDCTDGVDTKFLLSDAAVLSGTPLIYAGVLRFEGLAMRIERGGPCLRCLFESPPAEVPTCAQAGVLGSMAGVVGALQAALALRPLEASGRAPLHVVDGKSARLRTITVKKREGCPACAAGARPTLREGRAPACPA